MTDKQRRILKDIQSDANTPKHRLIELQDELEEEGLSRKAKALGTIIAKLEVWQNT